MAVKQLSSPLMMKKTNRYLVTQRHKFLKVRKVILFGDLAVFDGRSRRRRLNCRSLRRFTFDQVIADTTDGAQAAVVEYTKTPIKELCWCDRNDLSDNLADIPFDMLLKLSLLKRLKMQKQARLCYVVSDSVLVVMQTMSNAEVTLANVGWNETFDFASPVTK